MGGGGAIRSVFDLPFCVFLARDASNASVVCARAPVGPVMRLARTAMQATKANDRRFRFTSGLSAVGLVHHAGVPCINLFPLCLRFLDLQIGTRNFQSQPL